ncbi:hypothetical protein GCM10027275_27760 [Rhabdobacter roseus]
MLGFSAGSQAQQHYRIRADVSIKEKLADGKYRLTVGKVYYDKLYQKIVYKLTFPQKETLVIQDTTIYRLDQTDNLREVQTAFILAEFTVFHLALTQGLSDFGMKNTPVDLYKVAKVEKSGTKVITTWLPSDPATKKYLGKLVMSNVGKRLEALAIYGPDEKLLSRQFFTKYVNVKGVEFPMQVTQMTYSTTEPGKSNLQQSTYSNLLVDQSDEDSVYRHPVPLSQLTKLQKQRREGPKPSRN